VSRQIPTTLGERFGANLLRSRRLAGLSQEGLGELVGMNRTSVSALERGLLLPRIDTILKLAAGTSVSTCVLLEGMEWRCARYVDGDFYVPTNGPNRTVFEPKIPQSNQGTAPSITRS
jgi:transcriptional regulator with XRE-family HTH domain